MPCRFVGKSGQLARAGDIRDGVYSHRFKSGGKLRCANGCAKKAVDSSRYNPGGEFLTALRSPNLCLGQSFAMIAGPLGL